MDELPPNWSRYNTPDGKEYYHNSEMNTTQWEKPTWPGMAPDTLSFNSSTSEVYQYKPTTSDLELQQRFTEPEGSGSGKLVGMADPSEAAGKAPGGKVPTSDLDPAGHGARGVASGAAGSESTGGIGGFGGGLVTGMLAAAQAAGSEDGAGISGLIGAALSYAQQLFDVSSDDVIKRVKLALVPYPPPVTGAANDFRQRPDFWGPFWIATTAVLFLAATGNFARLLSSEEDTFKADYGLVSVAASMIYGFLVGVPLVTRLALWCSGHEVDIVNFRQIICVYGYSLAPTIPASVICLFPVWGIRWLAVLAGLCVSLYFIREHLWTDIVIEAPSLKWKMVTLICTAQAVIFIVYRVHFFSAVPT
mmetsp:Transcript_43445/g.86208  ORF Transcript_43445/g.86208 Transcript_43445/m.86208 type:complete len:362 (+) Transcript_43445:70-1155(+)